MENEQRQDRYKKIGELETLFREMEELLKVPEAQAIERFSRPTKPIFFIVGCARSGSTLLYQYLASTGLFAYPTNLMSRFYFAPYLGARIQQMLLDFDRNGEIFSRPDKKAFTSDLGKTFGPSEPHEFWYFWNRFFKFGEIQKLSDEELRNVDVTLFLKELAAIEYAFGKPLLMKAMKMNWHIPYLAGLANNIYFIFVKRDVLYNAQSLLLALKKFFGNYEGWYSFKPPNYDVIRQTPYYEQVIDQVYETNDAVEEGLSRIPAGRYIKIQYEEFCQNPNLILDELGRIVPVDGKESKVDNSLFSVTNKRVLEDAIWERMNDYYLRHGRF